MPFLAFAVAVLVTVTGVGLYRGLRALDELDEDWYGFFNMPVWGRF